MNRIKSRKAGKRIFSIMLAVLLLFNYIPETVYAGTVNDGEDVSVSGNVANYDSVSSDDADETVSDNTYDESGDAAGDESDNIPDEPSSVSDNDSEYSENNDAEDTVSDNSVSDNDAEEISDSVSDNDVDSLSDNDIDNYSVFFDIPADGYLEIENPIDIESVYERPLNYVPNLRGTTIPSSYNVDHSNMPALRSQSPYGSCWAHASIAMAEINLIKNNKANTSINLSELHLAYFSYNSVLDPLGGLNGDSNSCIGDNFMNRGGNMVFSQNILASWVGAASEENATYNYENAPNALTNGIDASLAFDDAAHLVAYYEQPLSTGIADRNAVKQLIMTYGAVGANFYADDAYSGDVSTNIYNDEYKCYYNPYAPDKTNHAVTIVGWDDNFSKDNFLYTPEGNGAWLIRNSWTTSSYYENSYYGYFWMSYYEPSLGNEVRAFEFDTADVYDNNYQYDGGMQNSAISKSSNTYANVFTAHAEEAYFGEMLEAVAFYTPTSNVSYEIKIYTNLSDSTNPTSGTLADTITGTTEYAGYYTVPLEDPTYLEKDDTFSVVVKLTKSGDTVYIGTDCSITASWYKIVATANAGESFYLSGSAWVDYGSSNKNNIKIKAFTSNKESDVEILPESLDIDSEILTNGIIVGIGETYTVTTSISPKTCTNKKLIWTSSDSSVATVNNGVITGLKSGQVTITVTSDAVASLTKSFTVTVDGAKVTSITVSPSKTISNYVIGQTYKFNAIGNPIDANMDSLVVWSSSDTDVATVDESGNVTTVGAGSTIIKALYDDSLYGTYSISVYPPAPSPKSYTEDDNSIVISWDAIEIAEYYLIRYNGKDGSQKDVRVDLIDGRTKYSYTIEDYKGIYNTDNALSVTVYAFVKTKTGYSGNGMIITTYYGPTYTIVYNVGNGTNNPNNPTSYKKGRPNVILQDPAAPDGYKFDYWYYKSDNSTYYITTIYGSLSQFDSTGKLTIYAHYSASPSYKITFNGNGGTGTMNDMTCECDKTYNLNKNTYTRTGYVFNGWNTKADGTGTSYNDEQSVSNLASSGGKITLYAKWTPITYTIAFNGNGGTSTMSSVSCTYDSAKTLPTCTFTKTGYSFDGWNTKADGTGISYADKVSVKNLTSTQGGTVTLYAKWKANTYTVAFNSNGGTGTINSVSCTYDTAKTLPACTFTKNGYTFTGWNTKADGTGTSYAPGASVSNLTSTQGATVTLYAQWSKGSYTIVFNANNGTGTMNNQVCAFDEEITLSANTYTRTGYTFAGWNTQSNGNGTSYSDKASVKNLASSGSMTLYAQWTPITYTIAFNGNGGTSTMSSVSCTYDSAKTLPTCTFTKTGYSFDGWNTKADGTGISYADKVSVKNLTSTQGGTVTLYAKWKANTYTVAFNSNGGTGTMSSMTGCTYDNTYYLTDNKFKLTGYMFAGWNTKADGTGTSYADCATVANLATSGTVTLYAQWTPITYTIAFDGNGGTGTSASMTQCSYDNSIVLTANGFTKEGYTFTGWNTSSDGKGVAYADGASVKNMSSVQGATITLYAQWKANKYTVVFDANSGTGTMNSLECTYGTSSNLPQCLFTKQGYTFAGWNTEPDGTGINYEDKADVLNLATEGNITLYAMWEGMPVTVTLCANGGQFDDGNTDKQITVYYDGKYTSLVTPERAGFTFGGWYVSLAGGNEITTNTPVTSCASHKLYAKWIANDGWHVSGRSRYYTSGGNRVYGQYDFSESESYYFNPSTGLLMTGLIKTAEGTYYGDSSQGGKLIKGEKVIGSNTYFFADDYRMVTGWYDNCYYDEITGARQTGFIEIEGNTYYLNPEKITGWQDIDGDRYYFDTNGIMVTGHQADINGKEYYFTEDGQLMTGWIETDAGEIYAVETDDVLTGETIGEIVKDRDRLIDGTMYKFNADGSVYAPKEPGVTEIGGKYYFFNADGVAVKGWYTFDDGKTYYFGSDGAALLGNQVINLKAYQFDADGVLTNEYKPGSSTFFNDEDGDKYYINKYGKAVTGWIYSGNSKYYMNTETGAAVKYAYKVGLKVYYFDAECRLVSSGNTVQIGNTTYSIKNDGSLKTGWVRTGGMWQSIPEPVIGIPGTVTQLPHSTGYIPEPMTSTQALAACQSEFNTENFESVYDVTSDTAGTDSVTDIIMTVDFEQLPVSTILATHADYHCLSSKNMMANY